jgi:hypothetical protein
MQTMQIQPLNNQSEQQEDGRRRRLTRDKILWTWGQECNSGEGRFEPAMSIVIIFCLANLPHTQLMHYRLNAPHMEP